MEDSQGNGELEKRRRALHALHDQWDNASLTPGSAEYRRLLRDIEDETHRLLDAEQNEQDRTIELARQHGARVIRVVASVAIGVWLVGVVAAAGGGISRWWLGPFVLLLATAVGIWMSEPKVPAEGQRDRLSGASVIGVSGVLILAWWLLSLPFWLGFIFVFIGCLGIGFWSDGRNAGRERWR